MNRTTTFIMLIALMGTSFYGYTQDDYPLIDLENNIPPYDETVLGAVMEDPVRDYYDKLTEYSDAATAPRKRNRLLQQLEVRDWENFTSNLAYNHLEGEYQPLDDFLRDIVGTNTKVDDINAVIGDGYFVRWSVGLEADNQTASGFIFRINGLQVTRGSDDPVTVDEYVIVRAERGSKNQIFRIGKSLYDLDQALNFTYKGKIPREFVYLRFHESEDPSPTSPPTPNPVPSPVEETLSFSYPYNYSLKAKRGTSQYLRWQGESTDGYRLELRTTSGSVIEQKEVTGNNYSWPISRYRSPGSSYFFRLNDLGNNGKYADTGRLTVKKRNQWLWYVGGAVVAGAVTFLLLNQDGPTPTSDPVFANQNKPLPPCPPGGC